MRTYQSGTWFYSLSYPDKWYDLANFGAPPEEKYFSDQNVSAPIDLRDSGIWLAIRMSSPPRYGCTAPAIPSGSQEIKMPVSLDGIPTDLYVGATSGEMWVLYKDWCYDIAFITYSAPAKDQHLPEVQQVIASFKFNR